MGKIFGVMLGLVPKFISRKLMVTMIVNALQALAIKYGHNTPELVQIFQYVATALVNMFFIGAQAYEDVKNPKNKTALLEAILKGLKK